MLQLPKQSSEKLRVIEGRLRGLRQEKARAVEVHKAAVRAAEAVPEGEDSGQYAAAEEATRAVKMIQAKIEEAGEEQVALLRTAGGPTAWSGGESGWADAARRLDIDRGDLRVDLAGGSLLRPMAATTVGFSGDRPTSVETPPPAQPMDRRFLYPAFPQQPLDAGDLAVVDFSVTASSGITGVERDPVSTAEKAVMDADITLATEDVKQFAIVVDDVPSKIFDAEPSLQAFLETEARQRLDQALDAHVVSQILAAAPPFGSTGSDLIAQTRNAVASSRDLGAWPTVLALDPADAAALDLTQLPTGDAYFFLTTATGSASPLWSLAIREAKSVDDPLVIDPLLGGVLYIGAATILIDPFTGLRRNTVDLRIEFDAYLHVRSPYGFWRIASS